jgi:hypothetical protein
MLSPVYDGIVYMGACQPCHACSVGTRRAALSGTQAVPDTAARELDTPRATVQNLCEKLCRIGQMYGN